MWEITVLSNSVLNGVTNSVLRCKQFWCQPKALAVLIFICCTVRGAVVEIQVYLQVNQLVRSALQSPDELLHMAVYNWLLSKKLTADLIAVQQPSLETYLLRTSELTQSPEIYDLLWKYYERNMNHAAAAKILYKLAIRPG